MNRTTIQDMPAAAIVDALCVATVTFLSAAPYLLRLGFYSDDWGLLVAFSEIRDGSLLQLIGDNFPARPVQGAYLALLFELFGLKPLGYHILNTTVLAASAALFYLLLLRLHFGRRQAFASTLLFIMLPQLSTVRVWYAAFQIPLSFFLMLASMHCQVTLARSGRRRWLIGALASGILGALAYEIFIPLVVGFGAALGYCAWRRRPTKPYSIETRNAVIVVLVFTSIFILLVYKFGFSSRTGPVADPTRYLAGLRQLFRPDYDPRFDSGLNIYAAAETFFWAPIWGWWTGAKTLGSGQAGLFVAAVALLIGGLTWWRIMAGSETTKPLAPIRLLFVGLAAFLLGNVTFFIIPAIVFTSTGIGNRVQVAAATGIAIMFAGSIALISAVVPTWNRTAFFASTLSLVAASAFVRISTIEGYWSEAPLLQQRILEAARNDLRALPANSTVILDGVCPYHGPAIIFETNWDTTGALTLLLRRPVNGDVVSPRMSVAQGGLLTSIYREPTFYPFSSRLYAYNPTTHLLFAMSGPAAAKEFFQHRSLSRCDGFVARGAEV